jgi:hypothetical protein
VPSGTPGPAPIGPGATGAGINVEAEVEANNAATQRKLGQVLAAQYEGVPASEVLDQLTDQLGAEVYVNHKALKEAGVDLSEPLIMLSLKKVRADMLLDLILQQVAPGAVDYIIRDGIVVITTVDSLDGASEVKAYPVADLLKLHSVPRAATAPEGAATPAGSGPGGTPAPGPMGFAPGMGGGGFGGGLGGIVARGSLGGEIPASAEQLIHVIHNTVSPSTWELSGGSGTITFYGDMLVIRQTARTHREVEKVLKLLRDTAVKK